MRASASKGGPKRTQRRGRQTREREIERDRGGVPPWRGSLVTSRLSGQRLAPRGRKLTLEAGAGAICTGGRRELGPARLGARSGGTGGGPGSGAAAPTGLPAAAAAAATVAPPPREAAAAAAAAADDARAAAACAFPQSSSLFRPRAGSKHPPTHTQAPRQRQHYGARSASPAATLAMLQERHCRWLFGSTSHGSFHSQQLGRHGNSDARILSCFFSRTSTPKCQGHNIPRHDTLPSATSFLAISGSLSMHDGKRMLNTPVGDTP